MPVKGSSPRGRGKLNGGILGGCLQGLIPAWAGKTPFVVTPRVTVRAHPRVGGENEYLKRGSFISPGSSPRGRGKLRASLLLTFMYRLIPAWAGKTIFVALYQNNETAHPRVGGEN